MTMKIHGDKIEFPDGTEQFTAYDGSSGGGSGGKTLAFRGELGVEQTVETAKWTKVELDNASVDTDNSLTDSKFQPSVAGYYQVNGSVCSNCNPDSTETGSRIYKNGSTLTQGSQVESDNSNRSSVGDVIYLNGSTDYLELYGIVKSSGTCAIRADNPSTYLSAVLVSGGSASGGDSIWSDVDGDAVLETDGKKLTIDANVGELGLKSRITTDASTLELKVGSGGLADVSISDTEVTLGADSVTSTMLKGKVGFNDIPNDGFSSTAIGEANGHLVKLNDGGYICVGSRSDLSSMSGLKYVSGWGDIALHTNGGDRLIIDNDGSVKMPSVYNGFNTGNSPNIYMSSDGMLHRSTSAFYSAEEVELAIDKKVAVKDKIIEKLEARLTKLEARIK